MFQHVLLRDSKGSFKTAASDAEVVGAIRTGSGLVWAHVDSNRADAWPRVAEQIGFHPLAVEDTLSPHCRVKQEEYEMGIFVVVRDAYFATETPEPYDFASTNLYLFLGQKYLITVHAGASRPVETLADRLRSAPELIERGVDYLAYHVIDTLVDLYFPLLDEIDNFVDEIESDVFENAGRAPAVNRVFELKRMLLALRRHQAPMREVTATLANRPMSVLSPGIQIYFRDVYDHVVRQLESVETYRDLLSGVMDMYFSIVSNRMNEVIKALSVIATVVLPPTLIAGIYGMNFTYMPFPHWDDPNGWWISLVLMFGITAGLLIYIKWKRWL
ncbi:MAG TPA: magnesium/cobalt transporter CorA [Longimicrobiales bacterium]|nr:magnesium/cobalt transporter CorA [Longimicrobiales bacterium]